VLIDRAHRGWLLGSTVFLGASAALYGLYALTQTGGPKGDTWIGLGYGLAGTLMILFAGVLGARKKVLTARMGTLHWWTKAHLYLGTLSLPMILFHGAFKFGGPMTTLLMWLFIFIVLSGIVGALLQHLVPRVMLGQLDQETSREQVDRRLKNLEWKAYQVVASACGPVGQAEHLVKELEAFLAKTPPWGPQQRGKEEKESAPMPETGWLDHAFFAAPEKPKPRDKGGFTDRERSELTDFYVKRVMPYLARPQRPREPGSRALMTDAGAVLVFDAMRARLGNVKEVIGQLEGLCHAARAKVRQVRLHRLLHGWLLVHIPLSMALMVLMVAHIVMALRY
jgi:hypothetical protein